MDVVDLFNLVGNLIFVVVVLLAVMEGIGYALMRYWKKYRWAANYYSALLALLPFSAMLYVNRSWARLCLLEFDHALDDCARAIKHNDQLAMAYNNRAAAYMGLYRFRDAYWAAQHAIQLDDKLWAAYYNRGCALHGLKDYEAAIKDFDVCIEQRPGSADQYFSRANCYLHLQQYERAIEDYSSSIDLMAHAWNAYHNRAYAYLALNDIERGYADICKSCEFHPTELLHYLLKTWCELCLDPRLTPERVAEFAALSVVQTIQPSRRHSYQGMLAWMRGEYEQALAQFELGIESDPYANEANYFWSGMALAALGRYEEAKKAIDYALQRSMSPFFLKALALLKEDHAAFIEQYV
ncbi:tetratricopeptide repeat protein [Dictyobacter aurantiacus]|uniref:Tetratricopeptide repeat protein n=1 Tax=Dictyobacter aurantiacus TaxID=1936993 RepID=A0A401ZK16_9CHLR|nr:tetratricopeptide repeat protein [Dictyobacter aurantiacus]GCE07207.1 hypothetical protein KDAU_45360 [Dictyobacter aurantiacus]